MDRTAAQDDAHTHAEGPPLLTIAGARATLTLNRPTHLNRLHREDLLALQRCLEQVVAERGVRVLVLNAHGRVFCAGYHLGDLGSGSPTGDPRLFEHTVDALERLPLPTVCALNGSVYGGATDLALACDFRVGVHGMELRMPAARLGLHYYPSGLQRYVSRLGLGAAKRLFLLAEAAGADELLRIGYLDRLAAPDALDATVDTLVQALAAGAPLAVNGMKRSLDEIARGEADLRAMREREDRCGTSADLREGIAAWQERRMARFTGN
jgi:enoyl-CoA hydratase/carnithine racemase